MLPLSSHFYFQVVLSIIMLPVLFPFCFRSLWVVSLCSFYCSLRVLVMMHAHNLKYWLLRLQVYTIERAGGKRTNEQTLGLSQVQKGSYVTLCVCRLTLAWISSENSTTLLECQPILTKFHPLVWTLSHADSSLCCPVSTALSVVRRHLPFSSPFVQLPSRVPLPTSGHDEISSPKHFVWFRAKTDKGIVCLADLLHSVTCVCVTHWWQTRSRKMNRLLTVWLDGNIYLQRTNTSGWYKIHL